MGCAPVTVHPVRRPTLDRWGGFSDPGGSPLLHVSSTHHEETTVPDPNLRRHSPEAAGRWEEFQQKPDAFLLSGAPLLSVTVSMRERLADARFMRTVDPQKLLMAFADETEIALREALHGTRWGSTTDYAREYGVAPETVRRWCSASQLRHRWTGGERQVDLGSPPPRLRGRRGRNGDA